MTGAVNAALAIRLAVDLARPGETTVSLGVEAARGIVTLLDDMNVKSLDPEGRVTFRGCSTADRTDENCPSRTSTIERPSPAGGSTSDGALDSAVEPSGDTLVESAASERSDRSSNFFIDHEDEARVDGSRIKWSGP